jgi:hypothetical protein
MNRWVGFVAQAVGICVVGYLAGAFVAASFDISQWGVLLRACIVALVCAVGVGVIGVAVGAEGPER